MCYLWLLLYNSWTLVSSRDTHYFPFYPQHTPQIKNSDTKKLNLCSNKIDYIIRHLMWWVLVVLLPMRRLLLFRMKTNQNICLERSPYADKNPKPYEIFLYKLSKIDYLWLVESATKKHSSQALNPSLMFYFMIFTYKNEYTISNTKHIIHTIPKSNFDKNQQTGNWRYSIQLLIKWL